MCNWCAVDVIDPRYGYIHVMIYNFHQKLISIHVPCSISPLFRRKIGSNAT